MKQILSSREILLAAGVLAIFAWFGWPGQEETAPELRLSSTYDPPKQKVSMTLECAMGLELALEDFRKRSPNLKNGEPKADIRPAMPHDFALCEQREGLLTVKFVYEGVYLDGMHDYLINTDQMRIMSVTLGRGQVIEYDAKGNPLPD